jgi:hypothetical protein
MLRFHFLLFWCCLAGLFSPYSIRAQPNRDCRIFPSFALQKGFEPSRSAFSTSEGRMMGLVLVQTPDPSGKEKKRTWQHPSWKDAGHLGPMVISDQGEVWAAPVPVINILENKPEEQNRLWKTDKKTGVLKMVADLPRPDSAFNGKNAFGILGLGYDCDNSVLYATSVSGSSIGHEKGRLFAFNTLTNSIVTYLDSLDAFGLGVGTLNGEKRLYYGLARIGDIRSIALHPDGSFNGEPRNEFSLEGLGPRGDDRARKIRFAPDGTLTVHGIEFYFNLTAPTEKQETVYQFKYNKEQRRWTLLGFE